MINDEVTRSTCGQGYYQAPNIYELYDVARNNVFRSALQAVFGLALIIFVVLIDHPSLGMPSLHGTISQAQELGLWVGKWLVLFGSLVYMLIAFGHLVRSFHHMYEAKELVCRHLDATRPKNKAH